MRNDAVTRATQALLRIVAGLLLFCPGALKIFGWFGGPPPGFTLTPLLRTAGWIEVIGGPLLMLGLFTRPAAFICSGEMAAAYFMFHAPQSFWPAVNQGDAAILFCFVFLYLAFAGAGAWSLDALFSGSQRLVRA